MNKNQQISLPSGITAREISFLPTLWWVLPPSAQAQRRAGEQSRSASGLSVSGGEEKSEHSEAALSTYSDGASSSLQPQQVQVDGPDLDSHGNQFTGCY